MKTYRTVNFRGFSLGKRILVIGILLALFLPSYSYDFAVNGIYYNKIGNGKVQVTYSSNNEYSGSVVIPAIVKYQGTSFSVTSIGDYAFRDCSGLTSVTVPNSVTSIGIKAFSGCSGLTSVNIHDIAAWCNIHFSDGSSNPLLYAHHLYLNGEEIKDLVIPNSVTSIGDYAFLGCSGLTSVTIPNSVTSIGDYAFSGCSGLTSVTIPNSVTSIGDYAFNYCYRLTSVTIPNSVTSIGDYAFSKCSGLTSVAIGNSVTSIGDYAFSNCSGLTSVAIGNSVTSIGAYAFYYCYRLTSVTIPNNVTSIGEWAFSNCNGLTSVTIGNSVTSIGNCAFHSCNGLTSVTIGNSVTSIGNSAFSNCNGLTRVNIHDIASWCKISFSGYDSNPLSYAHHLYLNGEEIKDLVIPNSVTSIGNGAFHSCNGLTSVTIGNSVTSIGNSAFSNCNGLTSVTIGNSVRSIASGAFYGCSGLTRVNIHDIAAWCKISFSGYDSNPFYYANHLYLNGEEIKDLTIPNSVTSIGDYAFYSCKGLTSVAIGNSVTSIGNIAFCNCSGLTSVAIGNSVTSIGDGAFSNCSGLTSVTIGNSVTSIGNQAFFLCVGLTSVTIGNSVTSIGYLAFYAGRDLGRGLTSVTTLNTTPPRFYSDDTFMKETYSSATLYVPAGTKDKYKWAEGWKNFITIVEMDSVDGIKPATASTSEVTVTGIYDTNGKELPAIQPGINIVRYSDGTTKKVVVK